MDKKTVVILTSHSNRGENKEWEPGDQQITEGVFRILPELNNHNIILIKTLEPEQQDEAIKNCDYVIVAGTPGWVHPSFRKNWKSCEKYGKHISFLGIGLAVPYEADFWYGREDFTHFKDSGLIDLVVCRDKYALYWIKKRVGFDGSRIASLPCPAFYMMDKAPVKEKKKVVFSIANIAECSISSFDAYKDYYNNSKDLVKDLKKIGAEVFITYMRSIPNHAEFMVEMKELFPEDTITGFNSPQEFRDFHTDKDIYIGVRNHGALPMSGAGKPSLLLGTDYRQKLAEEIPFLSKIDISYSGINQREVMDWYHSLSPEGISRSLIDYRNISYKRYRTLLKPLIELLKIEEVSGEKNG